jgi:hypothetical protein
MVTSVVPKKIGTLHASPPASSAKKSRSKLTMPVKHLRAPKPKAGGAAFDNPTLTRMLPIGASLCTTAPLVPLSSAVVVPSLSEKDKWVVSDQQSVSASLRLIVDETTVEKSVDVDVGFSGLLSGVKLGVNASYAKTVRVSSYTISVLVAIVVMAGSRTLRSFQLTDEAAKALQASPEKFAQAFGDVFCSAEAYGGVLLAVGKYKTDSEALTTEVKGSLDVFGVTGGAWGDVTSVLSSLHSRENIEFSCYTEGVIQDIPTQNWLKSPTQFIQICNAWIQKAAANKVIPIRQYFTPFTAIPNIAPTPIRAQWDQYKKVVDARSVAQNYVESVLDIKEEPDAYAPFDPPDLLERAQAQAQKFVRDCDDQLLKISANPFSEIVVPTFVAPALPAQNQYSKKAVLAHLKAEHKVIVVFEEQVDAVSGFPLKVGVEYEVFIRNGTTWFCVPPLGLPKPPNVTSGLNPVLGTIAMWGQLFYLDNRGQVVHQVNGKKGVLRVVNQDHATLLP